MFLQCVFNRNIKKKKTCEVNDSPTFLLPHFNSLLEVKGMTRREGGKRGRKRQEGGESRLTRSSITTRSDRQRRAEWALLGSSS